MRGLRLPSDAQDPPAASSSSSTGSLRCEKIVFDRRNPLDLRRDRYPRNLKDIPLSHFLEVRTLSGKEGRGEATTKREDDTEIEDEGEEGFSFRLSRRQPLIAC